ncbi:hypothetical protein MWH25_08345 [Natroniella acetigena]|uniref:hypothetical protein n=1 Tax=Natroniella acetigena TaxID=52004 RepID=UPI00200A1319|nr:hypothetical protein [Natroniella acetigena]MCK8827748.1 hypothetical protein [Natroniella acetigena]
MAEIIKERDEKNSSLVFKTVQRKIANQESNSKANINCVILFLALMLGKVYYFQLDQLLFITAVLLIFSFFIDLHMKRIT